MGGAMAAPSLYSTRFRVVATLVIVAAVVAFGVAFRSCQASDDDAILESGGADEYVEALLPARNSQVPQQESIGIDLIASWTGTLNVNGVDIPDDELQVTRELGLVQFTPGDGRAVEELRTGQNTVIATVWPRAEGPEASTTVAWTFDAV
jgi:hypothetical protein